jgi:hypothetical protein
VLLGSTDTQVSVIAPAVLLTTPGSYRLTDEALYSNSTGMFIGPPGGSGTQPPAMVAQRQQQVRDQQTTIADLRATIADQGARLARLEALVSPGRNALATISGVDGAGTAVRLR